MHGSNRLCPPTPAFPSSRFEDVSLLLAEQPIFEDTSVGGDSVWDVPDTSVIESTTTATPTAVHHRYLPAIGSSPKITVRESVELDLDAYLPPDESVILISENHLPPTPTYLAESSSSRGGHKRDRSDGSIVSYREAAPMSSKPGNRDDFYTRRLSDSNRRASGSLPALFPSSLSRSISSSYLRQSSSSSSEHQSGGRASPRDVSETLRASKDNNSLIDHSPEIGRSETKEMKHSYRILSRSFASSPSRATPSNPPPLSQHQSLSRSEMSVAIDNEFTPGSYPPLPHDHLDSPSTHSPATPRQLDDRQLHLTGPTSQRKSPDANNSTSSYSISDKRPITTTDPSHLSRSPVGLHNRRSSTSERVLGFFTGFLRGSIGGSVMNQLDKLDDFEKAELLPTSTFGPPLRPALSTYDPNVDFIPLTRPKPFSLSSRQRKPAHPVDSSDKWQSSSNQPSRPTTTTKSAFASAALARLPPPGKGSSSSARPVVLKEVERARDISAKRRVFEGPTYIAPSSKPPSAPTKSVSARKLPTTIPVSGRTPGKASAQRAIERQKFDAVVREKMAAKEQQRQADEEARRKREEEEVRELRKKTVIRAHPVPDLYH